MLTFLVIVSHTLAEPVVPSAPIAIPILGVTIPHPKKISPFFSCAYELPILQLFSFQIHACNGGCTPLPFSASTPYCPIPHPLSLLFSDPCALLCAFLHPPNIQLPCFQSFPHSASKNTTTGGVEVGALC